MVTGALFLGAAACLGYTYVGYPLLLAVWARVRGRRISSSIHRLPVPAPGPEPAAAALPLPRLSIIVAAHDEAASIGARLCNLLAQDYPPDRLEIIVGSDGSSDGTAAAATACGDLRVHVLDLPRQGRAGVHNECVRRARGDILVFTDAGTLFDGDTLRRLVAPFGDHAVGCSSGRLLYLNTEGGAVAQSAGWYWSYEILLRRLESAAGSTVAVTGACMALRRCLYRPLGAADDIDDAAPIDVILQGRRTVFVEEARAYDRLPQRSGDELSSRRRIVSKNLTALLNRAGILHPWRHPKAAVAFLSHRVMRYLSPVFLLVLLISNLALAHQPVFRLSAAAQVLFYAGALTGYLADRRRREVPVLSTLFAFCLANTGFLLGLWSALRGRSAATYQPIRMSQPTDNGIDARTDTAIPPESRGNSPGDSPGCREARGMRFADQERE